MNVFHFTTLRPPKGKGLMMLLEIGLIGLVMLGGVNCEDDIGAPEEAGLKCISECSTCPMICPPPPPSFISSHNNPPPPNEYSYYTPLTTSPHSPPPQYYYQVPPPHPLPLPPPPPKSTQPPPTQSPSWYPSWGNPPPPNYVYSTPMSQGPPTQGQHAYLYPYYYFYASKASSLSSNIAILLNIGVLYFVLEFGGHQ